MAHFDPPTRQNSAFEEPLVLPEASPPLIGTVLGNYRIVSLIGKGGMAEVYRAKREGDFDHTIAIKIALPSHGLRVAELADRLRFERATLASLSHPHISRLFDGGTLPDGRPYLVMEYIEGEQIDEYCDRQGLPIRERLELFLSVCEAIIYAHNHLIAHRDLKPTNILVDSERTVRVLDFGIARAFAESVDRQHPLGYSRAFSPIYSPPEQMCPSGSATPTPKATAGDVYSLGAVLHMLITGSPPSPGISAEQRLSGHQIRAGVVPTSSDAGLTRSVRLPTTKADPAWRSLPSLIRFDLEGIVRKCLAFSPSDRYDSVSDLARDIRHAMLGRAVAATASDRLHCTRKHLRRFRVAYSVVAVLGCAAGAVGAAAMMTVSAVQRQSEELNRGLVTKKTTVEVLTALKGTYYKNMPALERVRDFLRTLPRETSSSGDGVSDAEALCAQGLAADLVDLHVKAEILFKRSLREWEEQAGANSPYLLDPLFGLSRAYSARHLTELAIPYLARAIGILEQHFSPTDKIVIGVKLELGLMQIAAGLTTQASEFEKQNELALLEMAKGDEHAERPPDHLQYLARRFLGLLFLRTARSTESEMWLRSNAENALSGTEVGNFALQSISDYVQYLVENGRASEAGQVINSFVDLQHSQPLYRRHSEAMIRVAWADVLASAHCEKDAIAVYELHLNSLRAELGVSHIESLWHGYKYALLLQSSGRSKDAEHQLESVLAGWEARQESLPVEWRYAIDTLASILLDSDQPENAFGLVRLERQTVLQMESLGEDERESALTDLARTEQAVRRELATRGVPVPSLPWDREGAD